MEADLEYQRRVLPFVSRTFALTIPELPGTLGDVVANGYLLCRIADTVEDEPALALAEKRRLHLLFADAVDGRADAERFAREAAAGLTSGTAPAERELVRSSAAILRVAAGFEERQRAALARCVRVMCEGMSRFQGGARGLADVAELHAYCYYVAGCVGEMLTELFCAHSPAIDARRRELEALAVSFGQGLQMTNILKDVWDDLGRGFCWLPRDVFARRGLDLARLEGAATPRSRDARAFQDGLSELVAIAHGHLRDALEYTLLVPARETGIRHFCLWALGMAVLTLRKLHRHLDYRSSQKVKITRRSVRATVLVSNLATRSDRALRALFALASAGLPSPVAAAPLSVAPGEGRVLMDGGPASGTTSGLRPTRAAIAAPAPAPPVPEARLAEALARARARLLARQAADGHWCFPLEADVTIPSEYVLMEHFLGEPDAELHRRIARYVRARQTADGGWPLYAGGESDLSATVKAYWALKLAGDDPQAPHMRAAREAVLARGGAARANVFTRMTLALFEQVPWRATPFLPVEIVLLPQWAPFHLQKVSYWSRAVMVPLAILTSLRARAANPTGIGVRELFVRPPEEERDWFPPRSTLNRMLLAFERSARLLEPAMALSTRQRALREAERWFTARLNGVHGLGCIFPAMVNALEALHALGYARDHPLRAQAREALRRLVVDDGESAYVQPCVSPVWDTGIAVLAAGEADRALGDGAAGAALRRACAWLRAKQITDGEADWREAKPALAPGGWAFQYENPHYPDLDDTSLVAWALHASDREASAAALERAADWVRGMQSRHGGFASFDADNTAHYLNEIPFADHGALLDPPTADVSARCACLLALLGRRADRESLRRVLDYLFAEQEPSGAWFGRWGTNYLYGTWSVLAALEHVRDPRKDAAVRRAVRWIESVQRPDGSWGESNDTYFRPEEAGTGPCGTPFQTAWAILALCAAGRGDSDAVRRGVAWLLREQREDGGWACDEFTAPGFPRVFHLLYHGYRLYFPVWALARALAARRTGGAARGAGAATPAADAAPVASVGAGGGAGASAGI